MSSDNLQMLFTAIVSIATFAYAILTVILVKETIKLREAQTEPEIMVYIQPSEDYPSIIDIVVRNIGRGTAYNVRWEFDRDAILIKDRETRLDKQNFFTKGAEYFAPGQTYHSFFGTGPELLKEPVPSALLLKVSFENRQKKKYYREYSIDPMQFYGRTWISGHGLREIANSLKDIDKNFDHIVSGFKRLKVDTYESSDRNEERKAREEYFAKQEESQSKKDSR